MAVNSVQVLSPGKIFQGVLIVPIDSRSINDAFFLEFTDGQSFDDMWDMPQHPVGRSSQSDTAIKRGTDISISGRIPERPWEMFGGFRSPGTTAVSIRDKILDMAGRKEVCALRSATRNITNVAIVGISERRSADSRNTIPITITLKQQRFTSARRIDVEVDIEAKALGYGSEKDLGNVGLSNRPMSPAKGQPLAELAGGI